MTNKRKQGQLPSCLISSALPLVRPCCASSKTQLLELTLTNCCRFVLVSLRKFDFGTNFRKETLTGGRTKQMQEKSCNFIWFGSILSVGLVGLLREESRLVLLFSSLCGLLVCFGGLNCCDKMGWSETNLKSCSCCCFMEQLAGNGAVWFKVRSEIGPTTTNNVVSDLIEEDFSSIPYLHWFVVKLTNLALLSWRSCLCGSIWMQWDSHQLWAITVDLKLVRNWAHNQQRRLGPNWPLSLGRISFGNKEQSERLFLHPTGSNLTKKVFVWFNVEGPTCSSWHKSALCSPVRFKSTAHNHLCPLLASNWLLH